MADDHPMSGPSEPPRQGNPGSEGATQGIGEVPPSPESVRLQFAEYERRERALREMESRASQQAIEYQRLQSSLEHQSRQYHANAAELRLQEDRLRTLAEDQRAAEGNAASAPVPPLPANTSASDLSQEVLTPSNSLGSILDRLSEPRTDVKLINPPPKYKGERRHDAAQVWLRKFSTYLDGLEATTRRSYKSDKKVRISLATNLLEGPAAQWWESTRQEQKGFDTFDTWEDFEKDFLTYFGDIRTADQKRDAFAMLVQTDSVSAFYTKIKMAALDLDHQPDEIAMKDLFRRGLKPAIRARIQSVPDDLVPQEFEKFAQFAIKCEQEEAANRYSPSHAGRPRTPFNPSRNLTPYPVRAGGFIPHRRDKDGDVIMAMNSLPIRSGGRLLVRGRAGSSTARPRSQSRNGRKVDRKGSQGTPKEGFTKKVHFHKDTPEIKARREAGLCFECGIAGHRARDCPQKPGKGFRQ
jgi:Retrotransposon gag protein/Zinc knuckle